MDEQGFLKLTTILFLLQIPLVAESKNSSGFCSHHFQKPIDVIFLLDASDSVEVANFEAQRKFVRELVGLFDVRDNATRIGLATFSDHFTFNFRFLSDRQQVLAGVDEMHQLGGGTKIANALKEMREKGFRAARKGAKRMAFIVTDHVQQSGETAAEAERARNSSIDLFAIIVGHQGSKKELQSIASRPDYVCTPGTYDDLSLCISKIVRNVCPHTPDKMRICKDLNNTDISFLVDVAAFGEKDSRKILDFTKTIIDSLDIDGKGIRAGVVYGETVQGQDIGLKTYAGQKDKLVRKIMSYPFAKPHRMVQRLSKYYTGSNKRCAVLFLADTTKDIEDYVKIFEEKEKSGLENMYIIAIGNFNQNAVKRSADHTTFVPDVNHLNSTIREAFLKELCTNNSIRVKPN